VALAATQRVLAVLQTAKGAKAAKVVMWAVVERETHKAEQREGREVPPYQRSLIPTTSMPTRIG
jgi:hypothetical protein